MMGWYGNKMLPAGGFDFMGLFFLLFWVFSLVDVILLAFWLWKQLQKR